WSWKALRSSTVSGVFLVTAGGRDTSLPTLGTGGSFSTSAGFFSLAGFFSSAAVAGARRQPRPSSTISTACPHHILRATAIIGVPYESDYTVHRERSAPAVPWRDEGSGRRLFLLNPCNVRKVSHRGVGDDSSGIRYLEVQRLPGETPHYLLDRLMC